MNGSPAICCGEAGCSAGTSTQRSAVEQHLGGDRRSAWRTVRFVLDEARLGAARMLIAWFCSGHSPPLSQIGQSSGWLISSSSMHALLRLLGHRRTCAACAPPCRRPPCIVAAGLTAGAPGATVLDLDRGTGGTRLTGSSRGWSQNARACAPRAARHACDDRARPWAASTTRPSIVSADVPSVTGGASAPSHARSARPCHERSGGARPDSFAAMGCSAMRSRNSCRKYWMPLVSRAGGAVDRSARATRPTDVVAARPTSRSG